MKSTNKSNNDAHFNDDSHKYGDVFGRLFYFFSRELGFFYYQSIP